MDSNWRSQLTPEARHMIVNKLMDTLKRHLPVHLPEHLNEIQRIAARFEEKIHIESSSKSDYLMKISHKMLSMERKTQDLQINLGPNHNFQNQNRMDPDLGDTQSMTAGMSNNTVLNVTELRQQYLQMCMQQNLMRETQIPQNQMWETHIPQNQMRETQIQQNQMRETQIPQNQMRETQILQNQMRETQIPQIQMRETQIPQNQTRETQIPQNQTRETQIRQNQTRETQIPQNQIPQNQMRETQIPQNQMRETQIPQNQTRETQIPQNQMWETQIPQNQMRETQIPQTQMRETHIPQNIGNSQLIQGVASSSAAAQTGALSELELEEMFQKVKSLKEQYFTDLRSIYERLLMKLNQIDWNLVAAEQIEKMKSCKNMLDQLLNILQLNKQTLQQHHFSLKDKLHLYEQQIISILQNTKAPPPQQPPPQQRPQNHTKAPQPPAQQPGQTGHSNNIPTELTEKSSEKEIHPIKRLAKALLAGSKNSGLHDLVKSAITDIYSVVRISDLLPGSAPGSGSRSAVRSDLAIYLSKRHLPDGNWADQGPLKKMKWDAGAVRVNDDDEFCGEMRKTEVNHGLMEEIKKINARLIDTELIIGEEELNANSSEGTVIKCSHTGVAISPSLKSQLSPILPLRLLVPAGYPKSVILDKLPEEEQREFDELSSKVRSRFSILVRGSYVPLSLKEIAKMWDSCARKVILESAQQIGGGSFSSIFCTWQRCVNT